jgi:hypothetical protein
VATKLQIYNQALLMMKERRLSGLTEDRESRRTLDEFYDTVVQFCLEQGMWKFAMRSTSLTQAGAGAYGFTYRFTKPSDLVHTFVVSDTSDYDRPLSYTYGDEGSVYYANSSPLYIRYSSNHATAGGGLLTSWPQSYAFYVAAELAAWTAYPVTGNEKIAMMMDRKAKIMLANALSLYSLVNPPGLLPMNSDARAITASETNRLRPDILPFGAEIKAMLSSGGQG